MYNMQDARPYTIRVLARRLLATNKTKFDPPVLACLHKFFSRPQSYAALVMTFCKCNYTSYGFRYFYRDS